VGLKQGITELIAALSTVEVITPDLETVNLFVQMYNNQPERKSEGNGYTYQTPALFIEPQLSEGQPIGGGATKYECVIRLLLECTLMNDEGSLDQNLIVIDTKDKIHRVMNGLKVYGFSPFYSNGMTFDTQHGNMYLMAMEYKSYFVDMTGTSGDVFNTGLITDSITGVVVDGEFTIGGPGLSPMYVPQGGTAGQVLTVDGDGVTRIWADPTGGTGGRNRLIVNVNGSHSPGSPTDVDAGDAADTDYVYIVTGQEVTIILPTAVGNNNLYTIIRYDAYDVDVKFTGAETANGLTSVTLTSIFQSLDFISDGTNYSMSHSYNGDVEGPAASIDSEVALFSGTSGKVIKRATATGIPVLTSGVMSVSAPLTQIHGLTPSNDDIIQRKGGAWVNRSIAQLSSDLGLTAWATKAYPTNAAGMLRNDGSGVLSWDNTAYLTANQTITLSGEASGSGATSIAVTLSNSAVIGKVLTGLNLSGGGTIAATDSILQAFGKVQNQISALLGGVLYQGVWNASTNSPSITSSVGTKGNYYVVNTAGSTNIDGITDWKVGDWIIFNGTTWDKVDNTDAVSSVNGFTGAVSLTTSNISEGSNLYYTDARARAAVSSSATGLTYTSATGVFSFTSGYSIPTNASQTNWDTAYTNRITSLTTTGTSGPATLVGNVLNIPQYSGGGGTPGGSNKQLQYNNSSAFGGANLYFDSANDRFGFWQASPTHKIEAVVGTLADGQNAFSLTATMPTTITAASSAIDIQVTSAGSSGQQNRVLNIAYLAGYTGSSTTSCMNINNSAAGTGTDIFGNRNQGFFSQANGTTTGTNVGVYGAGANGDINYGVLGRAIVVKNSATNVGVAGFAINTGTTPIQVAGYFGLQSSAPSLTSAALMCDNGSTTSDIFVVRDNGTILHAVIDGGNFGIFQRTPTSRLQLNYDQNSVSTADSNGFLLANATGATNGTQSISPPFIQQGNGWGTTGSASQDVRFRQNVLPVQGTTASGTWQLAASINGGAYSNVVTVTSAGVMTVNTVNGTTLTASSQFYVGSSTIAGNLVVGSANGTMGTNGSSWVYGSPTSGFVQVRTGIVGTTNITLGAGDNYASFVVGGQGTITEAASGTHNFIANVVIKALSLTNGAGATANTASLYIAGAPSGVTPTGGNYAIYVAAGDSYYGGYIVQANNLRTTAQFDKTNTTLADITGLSGSLSASGVYKFKALLHARPDSTGGFKVAIGGTCTATSIIYQTIVVDNATKSIINADPYTALAGTSTGSGTTAALITIEGTIVVNAAGTLTVQFAQNSASGTSSIIAGSTFEIERIL